jgi:hypothetical protein
MSLESDNQTSHTERRGTVEDLIVRKPCSRQVQGHLSR